MANTLQLKRGKNADFVQSDLLEGEPAFISDTHDLYIGGVGDSAYAVVMKHHFDANTILAADTDNTPTALTVDQNTVTGRLGGGVVSISASDLMSLLNASAASDFDLNGQKLVNIGTPTSANDATNKTYVDDLTGFGIAFHEAVLRSDLNAPLAASDVSTGDRFWIASDATGDWLNSDFQIAEASTPSDYTFEEITDGDAAFVDASGIYYFYDENTTSLKKLNTAIGSHGATHITGGTDEIDGDKLDIDWNPSNYTPSTTPSQADNVDNLTAHLYGIDQELGSAGASNFVALSDTPANFDGDALKLLRVNAASDAVEFVGFGSTYLEDSPSNGETGKAPTANWAYDHENATSGIHGVTGNIVGTSDTQTLDNKTIDCGTF